MLPIVNSALLVVYNPISVFIQVFFLFNFLNYFFPCFYAHHKPDVAQTGSIKVTALQNL